MVYCIELRTKFQVSSIILTSFIQGVILPSPPPLPQNPIQIRVNEAFIKLLLFLGDAKQILFLARF